MTGKTHRQFGITFAYLMLIFLYIKSISQINYYLAMPIILFASNWGAKMPDFDHDWKNVGEKTVISRILNIIIHMFRGKHRSRQTHSLDLCLIFLLVSYILPTRMYNLNNISLIDKEVAMIVLFGIGAGWLSHLFADMLNGVGIYLFFWNNIKIALVPKHIGKLYFNTGNEWESFCYKVTQFINLIMFFVALLVPIVVI